MSSKAPFFFTSTQSVANQIGEMFNFLWGSYTGLRELYWQVRGFKHSFSNVSTEDLEAKFLAGLPKPGGVDLKKICISTTWAEHERSFAKWLLLDACTLYEGWVEKVSSEIFSAAHAARYAKKLQFPISTRSNGSPDGYVVVVAAANAAKSALMATEFFPNLRVHTLNRWSTINQHLVAYRLFKECRNCIIHSDGSASQDVVDLHTELGNIQASSPNVFRHPFALPKPMLGCPIELTLRDCTLLGTLVHRMIVTFDAALSVAPRCEAILADRLRAIIATDKSKWKNLPNDPVKHAQRIHRLLAAAKVPEPRNIATVEAWMKAAGIL
jgi:hypothetical protein